jgi:hypothetical protein
LFFFFRFKQLLLAFERAVKPAENFQARRAVRVAAGDALANLDELGSKLLKSRRRRAPCAD